MTQPIHKLTEHRGSFVAHCRCGSTFRFNGGKLEEAFSVLAGKMDDHHRIAHRIVSGAEIHFQPVDDGELTTAERAR
jgi:hypothetical protein